MPEYIWESFRIAFAEQKLKCSPDSKTKYCKQTSAFFSRFYDNYFNKKQNGEKN